MQSSSAAVRAVVNHTLGQDVLVNAQGLTLYSLSAEQNGQFVCTGSCLNIWHPLAGPVQSSVAGLGTVKRPEGTTQETYNGLPLYTFNQDQSPGDTKGQGVKDVGTWMAVTTGPAATTPAPSTTPSAPNTTPAAPSGGGGSYGY